MENNKTNLPVTKVGRVGIRLLETKNGVNYQFRLVVPTELRKDGKREKTKIWINKENLKGKHRLTRAHREKQLKTSCQALHNAPPNRT